MKRYLRYFLIFLLALFTLVLYANPSLQSYIRQKLLYNPCNKPIQYKIGNIDPNFELSKDQVKTDLNDAANIWQRIYGGPLFTYNDNAKLIVNFVYDERTSLNDKINTMQGDITKDKEKYDQQVSQYEAEVNAFNAKLIQYNNTVSMWNKKGGAPASTYSVLIQQQTDLQKEAQVLNAKATQLNIIAQNFNGQIKKLNRNIDTFNNQISTKPEEGLYDPNNDTITIYFASNHTELIHTLAHELGHSIGMQHVTNSESVMFPLTSFYTAPTSEDVNELLNVCKETPFFNHLAYEFDQWFVYTFVPALNTYIK